jgi:polyhydroxyalkanoate synthesis regulator phasin
MPVIQQMFKEAWTSARAGVTAAEQEAEKVLSKIADRARLSPDEVRRTARELSERITTQRRELGERLVTQRRELERAFDDTVKRAVSRFKIPSRDDLDALTKRLDSISERVDALSKDKGAA